LRALLLETYIMDDSAELVAKKGENKYLSKGIPVDGWNIAMGGSKCSDWY
jgi:hypothetical protein